MEGHVHTSCKVTINGCLRSFEYKTCRTSSTTNKKFTQEPPKQILNRFNNHTKSFNLEHYENDTELSKEYWTIKRKHFIPKVTWRIIKKCAPFNTTKRKCYLCLNEKLEIASYKGDNLLNKRSELISKCRH